MGPTNRTASISPDVNDPGFRNVDASTSWRRPTPRRPAGCSTAGADLLLVETIFDTLNAKAALFAIERCSRSAATGVPVMISGTITDQSGRTLSGQTTEAFWYSVAHARPLVVGLNCALGAPAMRPYVQDLARVAPVFVSAYPNAGLPNEFGGYDETAEVMAAVHRASSPSSGLVNIVGGCCGTTPGAHPRDRGGGARACRRARPATRRADCRLSRPRAADIGPDTNFVNIGERTNVTGSRRFAQADSRRASTRRRWRSRASRSRAAPR